jgi:uncharacterized protein YlxW (UPF0749 family)
LLFAVLLAQEKAPPPPAPPIPVWGMLLVMVLALIALVAVLFAFRMGSQRATPTVSRGDGDLRDQLRELQERVEDLERDLRDLRRQSPPSGPEDRIAAK